MSVAGLLAVAGLLLAGRFGLGVRVLAGDVLAILLVVLLAGFSPAPSD